MPEVGIGQLATTTGRYRSLKLQDSVKDNHPVTQVMKDTKGIDYADGGRTIVQEFKAQQNTNTKWVAERGTVALADMPVLDAAEFEWKYMLSSVSFSLAEKLKNGGSSKTKLIELVGSKYEVAEASMQNEFHEGVLSDGTGEGGLQLNGIGALVPKVVTNTVGGIDRNSADAAFYRTNKFDTVNDWSGGVASVATIKRIYDRAINMSTRGLDRPTCAIAGQDHWEYLMQAVQAMQQVTTDKVGSVGFEKLIYRGVPVYFGGGVSFSGNDLVESDNTLFLNTKPGHLNLVFMKGAEFEMLEPIQADNAAVVNRLLFTMVGMRLGYAKGCCRVFDN